MIAATFDHRADVVRHGAAQRAIAVFALEQMPDETGKRLAGKYAGKGFHVPKQAAGWTQEEQIETLDALEWSGSGLVPPSSNADATLSKLCLVEPVGGYGISHGLSGKLIRQSTDHLGQLGRYRTRREVGLLTPSPQGYPPAPAPFRAFDVPIPSWILQHSWHSSLMLGI